MYQNRLHDTTKHKKQPDITNYASARYKPGNTQQKYFYFNYKIYNILLFQIKLRLIVKKNAFQLKMRIYINTDKNVSARAPFTGTITITTSCYWQLLIHERPCRPQRLCPRPSPLKLAVAEEKRSKLVSWPFNDCQAAEERLTGLGNTPLSSFLRGARTDGWISLSPTSSSIPPQLQHSFLHQLSDYWRQKECQTHTAGLL